MTTVATQTVSYNQSSLLKQQLYSRYAKGEITRQQLGHYIALVQPPAPKVSWNYRLAVIILTCLATALIPPYIRRND